MIYKIIFVCMFTAITVLLIKNISPSYAPMLSIAAGLICFFMLMPYIKTIFDLIKSMSSRANGLETCVTTTLKIAGISVLCEFAAQACADAGESYLAAKIDFAGKILIVCICAPEFLNLINTVVGLIGIS